MKKMKQRANFCVITQFLAHHFGLSCGKKSPLHAVVWCWSFWMVVRLNNSFRPLQQPAFAATISIVVPICAMECVWQKKCMMACNGEMRTVQQDSWYWNSEMHGHVTRYCFHLTGFCCFIFWTNWQPLKTQPQFIYKERGFRVCSSNLRRVQQHDSVDTMQWSHPVLNQQTSRKRPYAFFSL